MAGAKLMYNDKVKASTIIEVIVSMVIIVVVFGIAMMIYTNVTRMSLSAQKIKAQAILQEELISAEQTKGFSNKSTDTANLRIEQEVLPFNTDTLLSVIHLTAYDLNQGKITELQKLIIK
jgi:Tfp pilus assembly protein PilE